MKKFYNLDNALLLFGAICTLLAAVSFGLQKNYTAMVWAISSLTWIGICAIKEAQISDLKRKIEKYINE